MKIWEYFDKGIDKGIVGLTIIFLIAFGVLFKPWIHGFDTVAYFSWLHTVVIDGNLNVGDEFTHYGYGAERGVTPTGYTYSEWAVGTAVLWLPFYLFMHGLTYGGRSVGFDVGVSGYETHYIWAISLASALYAFIGILITYRLCREFFTWFISLLAVIMVWLSSSLVFYMYSHPLMSHANDTFAYALFIYVWYKTQRQQNWSGAILRGAAAGLCALVRQMNAVFVLVILLEYIIEVLSNRQQIKSGLLKIMACSIAWWLVYSPQLIVWRIVFGSWLVLNPYASGVGVHFDWLHPHILEVLFSTNRGLFLWTPLMLPATIGWIYLWRSHYRLTLLLVACFLLQLYVVASWGVWGGAAAFGQRFFTNMAPAFMLGLAALLTQLRRWVALKWLIIIGVFCVIWNSLLIIRYILEDVPRGGDVPLIYLIVGQFTAIPRYFWRIIQILITRG
jgi:hypothetical protein